MTMIKQEAIRDALADSDVFGALYDEEIDKLASYGSVSTVPSGRTVINRGDPGDSMMIVLSGRMKVSNISSDGKEAILNFIDEGRCFGEIALLDGKERTADVSAMVKTELFVLRRGEVVRFIETHPDVALRMMGILCQKLRHTTELVEDGMLLGMAPRVSRALLRLSREYGVRTPEGVRIEMRLSQRELGALAGSAREVVNRQLRIWKEEGVIAMDGGKLTILKADVLEELAEEVT
ncbi:MAG: Crp/Fnr family transcriptional regulator [Pseudomonadota bacterium]